MLSPRELTEPGFGAFVFLVAFSFSINKTRGVTSVVVTVGASGSAHSRLPSLLTFANVLGVLENDKPGLLRGFGAWHLFGFRFFLTLRRLLL